jgi:hypothetical protein
MFLNQIFESRNKLDEATGDAKFDSMLGNIALGANWVPQVVDLLSDLLISRSIQAQYNIEPDDIPDVKKFVTVLKSGNMVAAKDLWADMEWNELDNAIEYFVRKNGLPEVQLHQLLGDQNLAESDYQDLRQLQQQWWVALPAIMKQAGLDYQPVKELSRDYYPTLGWINIPGERFTTFEVEANPTGNGAKLNIHVDVNTSNEFYRTTQPERAAKLNAFAEKIAQALGGSAAEHMTGERKNRPGVSRITATMTLPKEPAEWQNPSRSYDPKARFLNQPGERARQGRVARSAYPDSFGGDASNYRFEGADERKHNALWAQITDYEKRQAKAERYGRDTQAQHFKQMADQLRAKLPTSDNPINELSSEKLAQYKTAAAADASASDKRGEYDRGNKRFSGIVKATNKQFANDAKKHR